MPAKQIGAAIKRRRLELGTTQEGLAVAAQLSRPTVGNLESAKAGVSLAKLEKALVVLDLKLTLTAVR